MSTPFLEYDARTHSYYVDGELVPSITQTMQELGIIDTTYFTEEHRRRGTLVHALTENYDSGAEIPLFSNEEIEIAKPYFRQWREATTALGFEIKLVEHKVFSFSHFYAGRLDRLVTINNACIPKTLIEIKTNRSGYCPPWTRFQLAAQAHALEPGEIFNRWAVVLTPNRWRLEEFPPEDFLQDRDDFLAFVRAVRAKRRIA